MKVTLECEWEDRTCNGRIYHSRLNIIGLSHHRLPAIACVDEPLGPVCEQWEWAHRCTKEGMWVHGRAPTLALAKSAVEKALGVTT